MDNIKKIHMGPAKCAVDLGDGSERGEYVNQDYILNKLGRPHRAISLMYCYYPLDETWPVRARHAFKDKEITFQWDYPYDDYFTYRLKFKIDKGIKGFKIVGLDKGNLMREFSRKSSLKPNLAPYLYDEYK